MTELGMIFVGLLRLNGHLTKEVLADNMAFREYIGIVYTTILISMKKPTTDLISKIYLKL